LGEVCSHVAALLFKVEASTRLGFNQVSCTYSMSILTHFCYIAATLKKISFQKFYNIIPTTVQIVETAKYVDISSFLQKLSKTNPNAVLFSITNQKPQPKLCGPFLPPVLSKQYSEETLTFSKEKLLTQCKEAIASIHITSAQADKFEKKNQLSCPSLLKKIMQYNPAIDTCATPWGVKHEHAHFELQSSGLIIHADYPFLAASPDAVITCDCYGKGVVEVKCSLPHIEWSLDKMCLHSLMPSHKYFTHINGLMAPTELDYCDFVCWTTCGLHIERIRAVYDFFLNMEQTLRLYFINIVLPKLLT
ncbi:hypothetical protein ACJMK2_005452, partial [Sinanodonta woodiana]